FGRFIDMINKVTFECLGVVGIKMLDHLFLSYIDNIEPLKKCADEQAVSCNEQAMYIGMRQPIFWSEIDKIICLLIPIGQALVLRAYPKILFFIFHNFSNSMASNRVGRVTRKYLFK